MGRTPYEIISTRTGGAKAPDYYHNIESIEKQITSVMLAEPTSEASSLAGLAAAAVGIPSPAEPSPSPPSKKERRKIAKNVAEAVMGLTTRSHTSIDLITGPAGDMLKEVEGIEEVYKIYYEGTAGTDEHKWLARKRNGEIIKVSEMVKLITSDATGAIAVTPSGINENPSAPDSDEAPALSAHIVQSPQLGPASREVGPVEFFMNSIPPLEFSRCVPFIDMQIRTAGGKAKSGLNMLRFVGITPPNEVNFNDGDAASHINQAYPKDLFEDVSGIESGDAADALLNSVIGAISPDFASLNTNTKSTEEALLSAYSGMEIFTTPQTFVSYEHDLHSVTGGMILDKSRPFLSLKQITISHLPKKQGTINVIQAKVDVVLHDRSRLADISQFIAPKIFKTTKVRLKFGWSHPDGEENSDNVYGEFLNSMKTELDLFLVKSDYGFTQDGQVNVSIILQNASSKKFASYSAAEGFLTPTGRVIAAFREAIDLKTENKPGNTTDVIAGESFSLQAVTEAGVLLPTSVYRKLKKEVLAPAKKEGKEVVLADVAAKIDAILSGDDSLAATDSPFSVYGVMNEKIESFLYNPSAMHLDPFLKIPTTGDSDYNDIAKNFTDRTKYVSFGKLVLSFIGYPIASSGDYDEVQVMFHSFNHCAGALWGMNISSFPINIEALREALKKKYMKSRSVSVLSLFTFVAGFLEKLDAIPYGVARSVPKKVTPPPATSGDEEEDPQITPEAVSEFLSERLGNIGCPVAAFKPPDISFIMENVPSTSGGAKSILKIHVYDNRSSPYNQEMVYIQGLTGESVVIAEEPVGTDAKDEDGSVERVPEAGDPGSMSEPETVPSTKGGKKTKSAKVNVTWQTAYQEIKDRMPVLTYGVGTSAINSLDVRGTTTGPVADALIIEAALEAERAAGKSGDVESGQGDTVTPPGEVQLVPAVVTINTLGCPLLSYAQQFMIEMNTGTTLEQVYGITQLSHTIGPGTFKSTATLYPTNSGRIASSRTILENVKKIMDDEEANTQTTQP